MEKYLYVPIEIFTRELNGILLLSIIAANNNWKVLFGGKKEILYNSNILPEGVFLLKSIVPGEISVQNKIIKSGHKITSIDAEGLLPSNGESGIKFRFSKKTIKKSELIFFWGNEQFKQARNFFPEINKISRVTGGPLIDYWNLKKSSYKKTSDLKKTILISSSFGYTNHVVSREMALDAVKSAGGTNLDEKLYEEIFLDAELQDYVFIKYFIFIEEIIKKNPQHRIILRPAPVENRSTMKKLSNKYRHTEMDQNKEISDSLLNCDLFIHINSTTSIEAYIYDKPIVTYLPENMPSKLFGRLNKYAMSVSNDFCDPDEASNFINKVLIESGKYKKNVDLKSIIPSIKSKNSASKNIIDNLNKIILKQQTKNFPSKIKFFLSFDLLKFKIKRRIIWLMGWLDYFTKIFSGKYANARNYYKYGKIKQSSLKYSVVKKHFSDIKTHLGNKRNISIKKISKNLFMVK